MLFLSLIMSTWVSCISWVNTTLGIDTNIQYIGPWTQGLADRTVQISLLAFLKETRKVYLPAMLAAQSIRVKLPTWNSGSFFGILPAPPECLALGFPKAKHLLENSLLPFFHPLDPFLKCVSKYKGFFVLFCFTQHRDIVSWHEASEGRIGSQARGAWVCLPGWTRALSTAPTACGLSIQSLNIFVLPFLVSSHG